MQKVTVQMAHSYKSQFELVRVSLKQSNHNGNRRIATPTFPHFPTELSTPTLGLIANNCKLGSEFH